MTTVYFATNRALSGDPTAVASYTTDIVTPSDPSAITYGTAFVDGIDVPSNGMGSVEPLQFINRGGFSAEAQGDLSDPGCNVLVFLHGFDNSFSDALTRAAFNREWFAQSGVPAADTKIVAFSWPSLGQLISAGLPTADYQHDQTMAGQSGVAIMTFFANLQPLLLQARAKGHRVILLAHSMGNWALQAAVESWFLHGNGSADLFDAVVLAAADEIFNSFSFNPPGRLSRLSTLARRIAIYFSRTDAVLQLSQTINFATRLGQEGPLHRDDAALFPAARFRMTDCSTFTDYDVNFQNSHQYYRRSLLARADIAAVMAGTA
jgi:esterase/lipase superfamily enzyme